VPSFEFPIVIGMPGRSPLVFAPGKPERGGGFFLRVPFSSAPDEFFFPSSLSPIDSLPPFT